MDKSFDLLAAGEVMLRLSPSDGDWLFSGDTFAKQVVDHIGSGDAYVGGFLYGLLSDSENYQIAVENGHAMSAVRNIVPEDLSSTIPEEIAETIAAHKSMGGQLEMAR